MPGHLRRFAHEFHVRWLSSTFDPSRSLRASDPSELVPGRPLRPLLRSLLTSRSASLRRPFGRKARSPRVRHLEFRCTATGSTMPRFGHWSFAFEGTLAPLGPASYPVLVHWLAASLRASFSVRLAASRLALRGGRCDLLPKGTFTFHSSAMPGTPSVQAHLDWAAAQAGGSRRG